MRPRWTMAWARPLIRSDKALLALSSTMVGQQAWIAKFKADLDVCMKTMLEGVGKEDRENVLEWAKGYLNVKVRGVPYVAGFLC